MRILEVCRVWRTHLMGGMPIAAHYHARALKMRGHEVVVATTAHQTDGACVKELDGIPIHHLPYTTPQVADGKFDAALRMFFKEHGPFDIVHSQSGGGKALIGYAPCVLSLHGYQLENAFNDLALYEDTGDEQYLRSAQEKLVVGYREREVFKQFDAVTALSENTKRDLELKMHLNNVHLVHNGIDTELFKPFDGVGYIVTGVSPLMKVILSASALIPFKGVHHLIEAMPAILENEPMACVVIAGFGPEWARLEDQAKRLGVAGSVRRVGQVPHETLPELYNSAKVFFSGSYHYSGLDMNVIEAAACGCPVVAHDSPGKRDVHTSNRMYTSPDEIAPMICDILKRGTRDLFARERVFQDGFDLSALGFGLERVFNRVL